MNVETVAHTCLEKLFQSYLVNPDALIDIADGVEHTNVTIGKLQEFLRAKNWIQNDSINGEKLFAQITIVGIKAIAPEYLTKQVSIIIKGLAQGSGARCVSELLEANSVFAKHGLDIVSYMESLSLIEKPLLLPNNAFIKLSPYGKAVYEKHKNAL